MFKKDSFKKWYIRICRYGFRKKYLPVMSGPLKGYLWTTGSSYEYIMGKYEDPLTVKTFCSWLQPSTVFYDLGANVGFYALLANRFINTGKIYSFEPMPYIRSVFKRHLDLNKRFIRNDNIIILPFAISDHEKETSFSNDISQQDANTYIRSSKVYHEAQTTILVKCYSIDELLQQGYLPPGVIKIDVEGAEYDVLKGAVHTLKKYKPHILLATHDGHLPGIKDQCINFLQGLGYTVRHTGNYNKQVPGLDDYIAVHQTKL